jgi:hypothetical protein
MSGSFLKGTVVGLACALIGGATVALAGSGVGGVFNLGVTNSVDAQSSLKGSTTAPLLALTNTNTGAGATGLQVNGNATSPTLTAVNNAGGAGVLAVGTTGAAVFGKTASASQPALTGKNTGGGPGGSFVVNSGVAPFTVNSTTKVGSLNADMVDGFHVNQIMSGGGRVAQGSIYNFVFSGFGLTTQATVTLTAPNNGFVLVQGSVLVHDLLVPTACNVCTVIVHVHDVSANVDSVQAAASLGNGTAGAVETVPVQWVFPVTPGTHSYTLVTQEFGSGGPPQVVNPTLTAEFIPFGHNGNPTVLAADGENTVAGPTQVTPNGISGGGSPNR